MDSNASHVRNLIITCHPFVIRIQVEFSITDILTQEFPLKRGYSVQCGTYPLCFFIFTAPLPGKFIQSSY